MGLPLEFSFKLHENDDKLFYSVKHDYLNEYMISWHSYTLGGRICTTHYATNTVEDLISNRKWLMVDIYK